MTRLDALELLLEELKRYDPARYQSAMCEVLASLGYADRIDAMAELVDEPYEDARTLH